MLDHIQESSSGEEVRSDFVKKFERNLWAGMDQKNILKQAFSIIPDNLRILRIINIIVHFGAIVWLFFSDPNNIYKGFRSLTADFSVWGLLLNTIYLSMVFIFQNAGPYELSWKLTYIIGEICASLAPFIGIAFFSNSFPILLTQEGNQDGVKTFLLASLIQIWCPLLILGEIFYTYYIFPKQHIKGLIIYLACYAFYNFLYTIFSGTPVYSSIDWKSIRSYFTVLIGFGLIVAGYFFGNMQYRWKMRKESKIIITTLQMNEVSTPNKLSQYAPIEYDF